MYANGYSIERPKRCWPGVCWRALNSWLLDTWEPLATYFSTNCWQRAPRTACDRPPTWWPGPASSPIGWSWAQSVWWSCILGQLKLASTWALSSPHASQQLYRSTAPTPLSHYVLSCGCGRNRIRMDLSEQWQWICFSSKLIQTLEKMSAKALIVCANKSKLESRV